MRPDRHHSACTGVEHPRRNHQSRRRRLADGNLLAAPMFAICDRNRAAELWVPAIVHNAGFADMGRMNGDSSSGARITTARSHVEAPRSHRGSTPSSRPASSTTSTRLRTCTLPCSLQIAARCCCPGTSRANHASIARHDGARRGLTLCPSSTRSTLAPPSARTAGCSQPPRSARFFGQPLVAAISKCRLDQCRDLDLRAHVGTRASNRSVGNRGCEA